MEMFRPFKTFPYFEHVLLLLVELWETHNLGATCRISALPVELIWVCLP